MKNIHILPTDKSSRLKRNNITKKISLVKNKGIDLTAYTPINIYITSPNEDINENDFIITKDGRLVQVSYLLSKDIYSASKVTLATDQDLIKDGVQAIDDEFLEWFVKNSSCEEVEVVKGFADGTNYGFNFLDYKIILPKEEPKQECFVTKCMQLDAEIAYKSLPKQETLEEAVNNFKKTDVYINDIKQAQERSYSEEEVIEILKYFRDNIPKDVYVVDWFKQFKKK